jgi:hypothetical protein
LNAGPLGDSSDPAVEGSTWGPAGCVGWNLEKKLPTEPRNAGALAEDAAAVAASGAAGGRPADWPKAPATDNDSANVSARGAARRARSAQGRGGWESVFPWTRRDVFRGIWIEGMTANVQ